MSLTSGNALSLGQALQLLNLLRRLPGLGAVGRELDHARVGLDRNRRELRLVRRLGEQELEQHVVGLRLGDRRVRRVARVYAVWMPE